MNVKAVINLFQAIVDRNSAVASAALVSSFHLLRNNPEVVRRWANEVQEAVSSDKFVHLSISLLFMSIFFYY